MPFYPRANAHNEAAGGANARAHKARRILIHYGTDDGAMVVKPGTQRPYPDWQNQHGPTGASADGITEAEAEQMITLTHKYLSANFGDTRHFAGADESDDDEGSDDDGLCDDGGSVTSSASAQINIIAATLPHGDREGVVVSTSAAASPIGRRKRGASNSSKGSKKNYAKLTASERAQKIAEEMEARADANQSEFGLLYAYQEEQRLQQQQQGLNGGAAGNGSSSQNHYYSASNRASASTRNAAGAGVGASGLAGSTSTADEALPDGIEVVQFDVTTPGGLAAHILATGGYACPDPTKPNPTIAKHLMSFPEDVERGARTPPNKHLHLGVGLNHKGIVKPLATLMALQRQTGTMDGEEERALIVAATNGTLMTPPSTALNVGTTSSVTATNLNATALNNQSASAAAGASAVPTYSPIRIGKHIGSDRPMSPMAALVRATGGDTGARSYTAAIGNSPLYANGKGRISMTAGGGGGGGSSPTPYHLTPLAGIGNANMASDNNTTAVSPAMLKASVARKMKIADVALSRQPWLFQDAVLDAQIMTDARLDKDNLKTGTLPMDSNHPSFIHHNHHNHSHQQTLHGAKVAGRNPKATMLLPRSSDDAYDRSRDEGNASHKLYDAQTGSIPLETLETTLALGGYVERVDSFAMDSSLEGTQRSGNATARALQRAKVQQQHQHGGGGKKGEKKGFIPDDDSEASVVFYNDDEGDDDGDHPFSASMATARGAGSFNVGKTTAPSSMRKHITMTTSVATSLTTTPFPQATASGSGFGRPPVLAPIIASSSGAVTEVPSTLALLAAESPFMKQKQLIGERILQNTFNSVEEKERRTISSAQRRRQEWHSASNPPPTTNTPAVDKLNTSGVLGGTMTSAEALNLFTAKLLNNAPGSVIGRGMVLSHRKASIKTLPPSSMTTRDVFIAQQRLLNANLREMYGNGPNDEGIEPEDLPDDDTDETLSRQYDHLLPFLKMENAIETRRFLCELWSKHVALATSVESFVQIVAKNRARHTIRHVAIPMVMRWIKTYRRNRYVKDEISQRMDEVLVKRPNSGLLRQRNECFQDWSDAMIDSLLEQARFIPFKQDQFVFFQGEPSKEIYLVVSGEVEVVVMDRHAENPLKRKSRRAENGQVVANLGPGMIFGEIASTTSQPRCASVRCVTSCDLLCFRHTDFARAGSSLPERSWQLLKKQCQRTRVGNIGRVFPLRVEDVQRHAMFAHWSHTAACSLTEAFKPIFLPQGEYVFMPPLINENSCVIIFSGRVKVVHYDNDGHPVGEPVFFGPGDIIGEKETVMVVKRSFNAVCVEPLEGYILSRGDYVTAAMHNATFAAKSREIVAARIAETWKRPPPPTHFLEDPVLSYLVSEEVLRALWEHATPKLIWQSELMLLAGQPCDSISIVVRGTFHERAATTRSTSAAAGNGGRSSTLISFARSNSPASGMGAPAGSNGPFRGITAIGSGGGGGGPNITFSGGGGGNASEAFASFSMNPAENNAGANDGGASFGGGFTFDVTGPSAGGGADSPSSPTTLSASAKQQHGYGSGAAGGMLSVSGGPPLTSATNAKKNSNLGASPTLTRSGSNLAAALLMSSASMAEEWNPSTDAAFLPPHLKRLEQRNTHRQYEEGLENGDAVVFGQLEIGVNHKYYLRTVWCTGTCHVWQIPRALFEATIRREHPRVWDAIISPKTLEAILENAENLGRLANDANPPRRAGI